MKEEKCPKPITEHCWETIEAPIENCKDWIEECKRLSPIFGRRSYREDYYNRDYHRRNCKFCQSEARKCRHCGLVQVKEVVQKEVRKWKDQP